MAIQTTDFIWRKPQQDSDTAANGGRMTSAIAPSGTKNNIFPDVQESERINGAQRHRKRFIHVANDDDIPLINTRIFVETYTAGDDYITIFLGTQVDTQADIPATVQLYGAGQLNADVAAGASSLSVMTESATLDIFKAGMMIRISDKDGVAGQGNEEWRRIASAPTYSGDVATIALDAPLANGYLASNTKVASVIEYGTVAAIFANFAVNSANGAYDITNNPILVDHIGGVEQSWTLDFVDGANFNVIGDTLGQVGTGTISAGATPINNDYNKPFFTLSPAGFSGSFQAGDTITFDTSPAAIPLWYQQEIPAGSGSLNGTRFVVGVRGESGG